MPAEDRVRVGRGELAALLGVAGLQDHRPALRAARYLEPARDVELFGADTEAARVGVGEERPRLLVRDDLVAPPRVEQLAGGGEELPRAVVALVLRRGSRRGGSSPR